MHRATRTYQVMVVTRAITMNAEGFSDWTRGATTLHVARRAPGGRVMLSPKYSKRSTCIVLRLGGPGSGGRGGPGERAPVLSRRRTPIYPPPSERQRFPEMLREGKGSWFCILRRLTGAYLAEYSVLSAAPGLYAPNACADRSPEPGYCG